MKRIGKLLLACLLAFSAIANAQIKTPMAAVPRPPQIWIDPALGQVQPIQLQDVSIQIRIEGFIASTTMDLTFFNPNGRILEGELIFPLTSGQTITGYALEVAGKLRQGVVVEKESARVAFEATERRGIDPGLAELTRGNVFRTRLYPIPANGAKRVAVSFDQPLLDTGTNFRYVLPLQFTQKIHHFSVHAEAMRGEREPESNPASSSLNFEHWQDSQIANLERTDFQPDKELAFSVERPAAVTSIFSVQDKLAPDWRTFAAQVRSAAPVDSVRPRNIKRITLFYDASGSARARNRARELNFLDAWFVRLGDVDVDLIAFRNDADAAQRFHIHQGDSSALRQAVEALPLDGGTSYGAIRLDPVSRADAVIVLGDGLSNFGASEPHLSYPDGSTPVVVFAHAAQRSDTANLTRMAHRNGGQLINLLETGEAAAVEQATAVPWLLQSMRVVGGECTDLAPATPRPVGQSVNVFGRCRGPARIDLQFGNTAGAINHRTIELDQSTPVDPDHGGFIGRLWATARIADLQDATSPDRAAITDLAKRFGVVTENTSMLVLDRVEDYVHYGVEPREPELLAQYQQLLAEQPKPAGDESSRQRHLVQVLAWWSAFKQWHDTPRPWLETVLLPAAQAEVARWNALGSIKDSGIDLAKAQRLQAHASVLQDRWLRAGADPTTRIAWQREASGVMLELDALRQHRLALAPNSDQLTQARGIDQLSASAAQVDRQPTSSVAAESSLPPPLPPAAAPPPPPPPPPATALADRAMPSPAGGALAKTGAANAAAGLAPSGSDAVMRATIELKEWTPNSTYIAALRAAPDPYVAYLKERESQAATPSFFLDCADYFRTEVKNPRIALRVLSNLAEIDVESAPLLRVLAYRLQQWDRFDLAVPLFEDALKLRGEEPQSYRDLALALTRQPEPDNGRAVNLLWQVVSRPWDARFPEIQTLTLHELNDVLERAPGAEREKLVAQLDGWGVDHRLLDSVPVELRVVLTWDADATDIDLWVVDPTGEVAMFNHPRTASGGHMSRDFTGGYGPEVFTIRRPIPGTYTVEANYYGSRQQKLTGDVTVQAEFLTHFDSGQSKREAVTRRLENKKELIEVGKFVVGAAQ